MAEQKLELIVDIDETGAITGIKKIETATKTVSNTTEEANKKSVFGVETLKKAYSALGALMTGVISKALFSLTKSAAEFEEQSATMAKNFGVNVNEVISRMKQSSGGVISNLDAVRLASKAMSLGVTTDTNTLGTLMEFAKIKSEELGKDVNEVFDQLVEGIGRGSAKVLTSVGIEKEAFDKHGVSIDTITSKQKLLSVVMEKATDYIKKNGEGAESSADRIDKLVAMFDDLKLQLGQSLIPILEAIAPIISGVFYTLEKLPGPLKAFTAGAVALTPVLIGLWTAAGPIGIALAAISAGIVLVGGVMGEAAKDATQYEEKLRKSLDNSAATDRIEIIKKNYESVSEAVERAGLTVEQAQKKESEQIEIRKKKTAELKALLDAYYEKQKENQEKGIYGTTREEISLINKAKVANEALGEAMGKEKAYTEEVEKARFRRKAAKDKEIADEKMRQEFIDNLRKDELKKSTEHIDLMLKKKGLSKEDEVLLEQEKARIIAEINDKHQKEHKENAEKAIDKILGVKKNKSIEEVEIEIEKLEALKMANLRNADALEVIQKKIDEKTIERDDKRIQRTKSTFDTIVSVTSTALNTIDDLASTIHERELERIDEKTQATLDAINTEYDEKNTASEKLDEMDEEDKQANLAKLAEERDAAVAAGDDVLAKEKQRDIDRINFQTENDAIEAERAEKLKEADKEGRLEKWKYEVESFNVMKAIKIAEAIASTAAAVAATILIPPAAIAAGIAGAVQVGIIASQQPPSKPKFAMGGTLGGSTQEDVTSFLGTHGETVLNLKQGQNLFDSLTRAGLLGNTVANNSTTNMNNNGKTYQFYGPVTFSGSGEFSDQVSSRLAAGGNFT